VAKSDWASDPQRYCAWQSSITDPGRFATLLNGLPAAIPDLVKVVQGLIIHPVAVEGVMGRFHLGHLPLVREAFPTAQCFVREDAFLFPTTDAALSYYGSGLVDAIVDPPDGGEHRSRLLALVGDEIDTIIRRDGVFRVPKDSGCFVDSV
jgi:hypothetical protein